MATASRSSCFRGFSLVEVTLAMGLLVFVLVAIMALLSAALKSELEAERETQATFVSQNIFSDLASGAHPTNTFIVCGEDLLEPAGKLSVNLSINSAYCVIYSEQGTGLGPESAVTFGLPNVRPGARYGARVTVSPLTERPNVSRVEVQVEVPVTLNSGNRSKYQFVAEIRNQ
jgi:type II secretory pathway pseudopilin PulG